MTTKELLELFNKFIVNDFEHHCEENRADFKGLRKVGVWTLITLVAGLLGLVTALICMVLK